MDEQKLAKVIVDEFLKRVYQEVGKSLLRKIFWVALICILSASIYFGLIRVP